MQINSTIVLLSKTRRVLLQAAVLIALLLFNGCSTARTSATMEYRLADQQQICKERRCVWIENGVSYCSCNINSRARF